MFFRKSTIYQTVKFISVSEKQSKVVTTVYVNYFLKNTTNQIKNNPCSLCLLHIQRCLATSFQTIGCEARVCDPQVLLNTLAWQSHVLCTRHTRSTLTCCTSVARASSVCVCVCVCMLVTAYYMWELSRVWMICAANETVYASIQSHVLLFFTSTIQKYMERMLWSNCARKTKK